MNGLLLHDPLWLLALLPAIVLPFFAARRRARPAAKFSSVAPLAGAPRTARQALARLLPFLRVAGLVLLVVALARPQQGREEFRVRADGISIAMAIDRSGSMAAMDFKDDEGRPVERIDAVKRVFRSFVAGDGKLQGRPDDWIGLVAFGGFAESRCPLTLDHDALLETLKDVKRAGIGVDPGIAARDPQFAREDGQTAIGDGLALAVERVKDAKTKSRIVILLSDGDQTAGALSPEEGAELAKAAGVKVYTIGIGSNGPAPFLVEDGFGRRFTEQHMVTMNEGALKQIAASTGGRYFNARDSDALKNVYEEIDALERTTTEGVVYTQYRELFEYALYPALLLLLAEFLARRLWLRSFP